MIEKYNLLTDDGLVILESNDRKKLIYSNYYSVLKKREYGEKFILILIKS